MSWHADRAVRHRQRGLASLEFVLVLPILLVITLLAMAMVKLGHMRLEMQISARNVAYEKAYDLKVALPFGLGLDIAEHTPWYVPGKTVKYSAGSATAGDNFHDAAVTGHERFGALHADTITPTVMAATSSYTVVPALGAWNMKVREQYAVVASVIWERKQIPLGYDQYLYDRLEDHKLVVEIPGLSDLPPPFDSLGDLFSGYASDAVPGVFPKVKK